MSPHRRDEVVRACAISDRLADLRRRYPGRRIIEVDAHNDLRGITAGLATLMKVRPLDLVPLNSLRALWITLQARLHGFNSRMPPLLGGGRRPQASARRNAGGIARDKGVADGELVDGVYA